MARIEDPDYEDIQAGRLNPQDILASQKNANAAKAQNAAGAPDVGQALDATRNPTDAESYRAGKNTLRDNGMAAPIRRRYSDSATEQQASAEEQKSVAKNTAGFEQEQARANEQRKRDSERQQAAQAREQAAAEAKALRGQMHNFKKAGGVTEFDAAGNETPSTHADGRPKFQPGDLGEPPMQDESGAWRVAHRNAYGETELMPAEQSPHFHEDATTGEQTFTRDGQKLPLGVNANIVERNKLKTTQAELDRDTTEERIALQDARIAHQAASEAVKPFSGQMRAAQTKIDNLAPAWNAAKAAGRNASAIEKQIDEARKVLADPNYLAAKANLDAVSSDIETRQKAIVEKREKSLAITRDLDKLKAARLLPATVDHREAAVSDPLGQWPADAVTTDTQGRKSVDADFLETRAAGLAATSSWTRLSEKDEPRFQNWFKGMAQRQNLDADPDAPNQRRDWRGVFAQQTGARAADREMPPTNVGAYRQVLTAARDRLGIEAVAGVPIDRAIEEAAARETAQKADADLRAASSGAFEPETLSLPSQLPSIRMDSNGQFLGLDEPASLTLANPAVENRVLVEEIGRMGRRGKTFDEINAAQERSDEAKGPHRSWGGEFGTALVRGLLKIPQGGFEIMGNVEALAGKATNKVIGGDTASYQPFFQQVADAYDFWQHTESLEQSSGIKRLTEGGYKDPRWWISSVGENLPMLLPGIGTMAAAEKFNLGSKAVQEARVLLRGVEAGSVAAEAGKIEAARKTLRGFNTALGFATEFGLEYGSILQDAGHDPNTGPRRQLDAGDQFIALGAGMVAGAVGAFFDEKIFETARHAFMGAPKEVKRAGANALLRFGRAMADRLPEWAKDVGKTVAMQEPQEMLQTNIEDLGKLKWQPEFGWDGYKEDMLSTLAVTPFLAGGPVTVGHAVNAMRLAAADDYTRAHVQMNALRGKLDTARMDGDGTRVAGLKDQILQVQKQLASSATLLTQMSAETRQKIGRVISPDLDADGIARQLDENDQLRFASVEIGRAMRPFYLQGGKEAAVGTMLAGNQAAVDQLIGAHAVARDLVGVLQGGKIEAGKAAALDHLGLLEMDADEHGGTTYRVTDDALPLLPAALREQVASDSTGKYHFKVTSGQPGSLVNNLVKSGEDRLATEARARNAAATPRAGTTATPPTTATPGSQTVSQRLPESGASNEGSAFKVSLNVEMPGIATRRTIVKVAAANEAEAAKIAVAQMRTSSPKDTKVDVVGSPEALAPAAINGGSKPKGGQKATQEPLKQQAEGDTSAERLYRARQQFHKVYAGARKSLIQLGIGKVEESTDLQGPMMVTSDTLFYSAKHIALLSSQKQKHNPALSDEESIALVLDEERWHAIGLRVLTKREAIEVAQTAPKMMLLAARKIYGAKQWDRYSNFERGHELVRMVLQDRYRGTLTEQLHKAVDRVVTYLRSLIDALPEDTALARAVERVQAISDALAGEERISSDESQQSVAEAGAVSGEAAPASSGATFTISTPQGNQKVRGRWKIVEASELTTSDRPAYNQALQRRQRGRNASAMQIAEIAHSLDPARLGESATSDLGAPLVNAKGEVLSGNGRTMALRRVYEQEGKKAAEYREFVEKQANERGLGSEVVKMRNPVLVREVSNFGSTNEAEFADLSNRSQLLGRSAVETAMDDGRMLLDEGLLSSFAPGDDGDVLTAGNRTFNRLFIQHTADRAQLTRGDGAFSLELEGRVRRAVLAALLQRLPEAAEAVTSAIERADKIGLTRQINGIMSAAGRVLKLQQTNAEMDIAPALAEALAGAIEARGLIESGKAKTIDDALGQGVLFGEPSEAAKILTRALLERTSAKGLRELLNEYAEVAEKVVSGPTMFGEETPGLSPADVLGNILNAATRAKARAEAARGLRNALGAAAVGMEETPEETAGLDLAMANAEAVKPALDAMTREIAAQFEATPIIVPLKKRARALVKVRGDYAGDFTKLKDLARVSIETRTVEKAQNVAVEVERRLGVKAKRNNFLMPVDNGYRDALFHGRIEGKWVEIQVHVPEVLYAKSQLHQLYERVQEIERTARMEEREQTAGEQALIGRLNVIQRRVYDAILGINSAKSSGLQENAPLASNSSGEMGRGGSLSKAKALPLASTTTPNAPSGAEGSETSLKPTAPGNRALTSSSVITKDLQFGERSVNAGPLFSAKMEPSRLAEYFSAVADEAGPVNISGGAAAKVDAKVAVRALNARTGEMESVEMEPVAAVRALRVQTGIYRALLKCIEEAA